MNEDSSNPTPDPVTPSVAMDMPAWIASANDTHRSDLLRYAYSISGDAALAQDAVQETFLRLMRQDPQSLKSHLAAWLFRVCRSRVIDAQRKERRLIPMETENTPPRADPAEPDPALQVETADTHAYLWEAIGSLPAAQQEVMRLKYQAQLSYKEIAEVTGKSVNAVGVSLHTALNNLRAHLAANPEW